MRRVLAGVAVAAALLSGCSGDSLDRAGLVGTWQLTEGQHGGQRFLPIGGRPITLVIANEGRRNASGSGGCNDYGSTIEIHGDELELEEIESTVMGCEGPVGEVEAAYFAALIDVDHFAREGSTLSLTGDDLALTFEHVG